MTTQARELAKIVNNAGDLFFVDDVALASDGAVLNFGADNDVTLTHVADTGLLINSSRQLQFGDSGTFIRQEADGVLDLTSDTEIELNATTLDINANVDISGTGTFGGNVSITSTGDGITLSRSGFDTYAFRHSAGVGMAIHNTTDNRQELFFNGSGEVSGDLNDTSDIAFKKNIKDLESVLDKVKLLKPRTFTWKGNKAAAGKSVGFVAQEVETVITDDTIVKGNDYNEDTSELIGKSINTIGLVSYLTKAIQEQQTIIEDLKSRIETLEG